jgi:predicted N-acetyltransferase YhbS
MTIRNATYHDAPAIKLLLESLGYKTTHSLLVDQLEYLFNKDDDQVFVYELKKEVLGFVSVHYLPQLAFDGGLMVITYLSADDEGIALALERFVTEQARIKKCERIQVNGADWRTPAHQFYLKQGYQECAACFAKRLVY